MFETGLSLDILTIAGFAFLLAGLVKGVVGGGIPAVAVPIIAGTLEPALAAALTFVPVVATNVWLLSQGGLFMRIIKSYWPFLGLLAIGSAIGSQILVSVSPEIMKMAIGTMV
ncbi:MAG: putative membrane protein YfcA, partial [Gammaproteobacteria bacterium]